MDCFSSPSVSDLCGARAYRFAADRDIALLYANYAKRRNRNSSVVIAQIAIPDSAIKNLSSSERRSIRSSRLEWKELVFYSRQGRWYPAHLQKYSTATLITGPLAATPDRVVRLAERHRRRLHGGTWCSAVEGIPPYRSEHRHWEEVARWRDEQLTESREIGGT